MKLPPNLLEALSTGQPFDWRELTAYYNLPPGLITNLAEMLSGAAQRVINKTCWRLIAQCDTLTEQEIEQYQANLDWYYVVRYQQLSEEFMDRYQAKLNWDAVSYYQQLSAQFMDQHQDKLAWYYIAKRQELSEEFILSHLDLLDLRSIKDRYPEIWELYNLEMYERISQHIFLSRRESGEASARTTYSHYRG